jgi:serine/threonine protein kinase
LGAIRVPGRPEGEQSSGVGRPEKVLGRAMEQGQTGTFCAYLSAGSLVGNRYRIVRTLGAGGMASVYLVEDEVLGGGTQVALKILKQGGKISEAQSERFLREVRLTHKINHENVVRTFDFGQEGETRFYTMEHLSGKTLSMLMDEHEQLPIDMVLRIAIQVCRGLGAIHAVGVTHRDLKPDNIMVVDSMRVKITDFGVARGDGSLLTVQADEIIGTIAYLAPETLLGEKATTAVDYYSFAVVLYQLLTGRLPIEDDNPARLIMRKIEETPVDPRTLRSDIPEWLADGILGLLDPDPVDRMEAVKDFVQKLVEQAPAFSETDHVTASLGIQISELPTSVLDNSTTSAFKRIRTASRLILPIKRVVACIFTALCILPFYTLDISTRIEYEQLDNLFRFRGAQSPHSDVVIVSIDEPSYLQLGIPMAEAWPRHLHAKLLAVLERYGAKKVIFDILFVSPSADPAADEEFAKALTKVPTILGASIGMTQQATANGSFVLEQMIRPLPLFEKSAAGIGVVGFPQFHSRIRNFYSKRSELFPDVGSLAEAASDSTQSAERPGEQDLINYYGPASTIRRFSYHDVISDESRIPAQAFKDKRVFVGLNLQSRTGPSQREAFGSPFDSSMFGTEIHATAASNILSRDWIRRAPVLIERTICVGVVATTLLALFTLRSRGALLAAVSISLVALVVQYVCFSTGLFVPLVAPVCLGIIGGLILRMWFHHNSQIRKRRWS